MLIGLAVAPAGAATDPAALMSAPIYQRINPTTGANLVTPWKPEADTAATQYGYTLDWGTPFTVSVSPAAGLVPVQRLYHAANTDFTWAIAGSPELEAAKRSGYVDQGVGYYALPTAVTGATQPVQVYVKGTHQRLAVAARAAELTGAGWTLQRVAFHVPAPAAAPVPSPSPTTATPTPTPTPTTATPYPAARTLYAPGASAVGSASFAVPAGALYVATTGSDTNAGTQSAPLRTIARALALVPDGGTIVLRAGVYGESLTLTRPNVTLQNYPGEQAWLDGSRQVTGWVPDGSRWRVDGWTNRFDHSPTYTKGAPDSTQPNWQFVNPAYPMAPYPDQVFVNGAPQRQVASLAQLVAGTFYLDESTSRLYLGTDPTGKRIDASVLFKAMSIRASGVKVRGIGVRRYAPSVWHMGAITVEAPSVRFENVTITDSATTGLSVLNRDVTLERLTVRGSGMLGVHGRFADNLTMRSSLVTANNTERFNHAPNAGGVKLGQTRGVTVKDSAFTRNDGTGFWEDMSCYNSVFSGNAFTDNLENGLFLEISAKATVADNLFTRNRGFGVLVNNTSNVNIWNNAFAGNNRPFNLVQDNRRNVNKSDPAVDPRIAWPDAEMPWTLGPVTVRNNVVGAPSASANCQLCVEDYSQQMSAEQMRVSSDANMYQRNDTSSPRWIAVWERAGTTAPFVFTRLADLTKATRQEVRGREFVGTPVLDSAGRTLSSIQGLASSLAEPMPSQIAAAIGWTTGTKALGKLTEFPVP